MNKLTILILCLFVACDFKNQKNTCDESPYVTLCESFISTKVIKSDFFVEKTGTCLPINQIDYTDIEHRQYALLRKNADNKLIMFKVYDYGQDDSQIAKYYLRDGNIVACSVEKRFLDISCGNSEKDMLLKATFFLCNNAYLKQSEQRLTIDGKQSLGNCESVNIDSADLLKMDNVPTNLKTLLK